MATDRYIKKLFHVCITVPDIDAALEFYQGVLGLESIGSLRNEKTDGAALGFPGQEIEIHADHLAGKLRPATIVDEGPYRETSHVGITRIAFRSKRYRCDLQRAPHARRY
jgi:catechol 2,3-dioxygenase-like lactoylglutathione lyase family enzyme